MAPQQRYSIPWSEVNPETLGVWLTGRDPSLNLVASPVLVTSSTGHWSPENSEAEACVFATECFSVAATYFGISEASGVRTSLYYKLLTK